jgi:CheY-like chemotaxis protein
MPDKHEGDWDRTAFPELRTQHQPPSTVAPEKQPPSHDGTRVVDAKSATQFRFRILVVDDELAMRELAQRTLESEGYEVLSAIDGLEALHALGRSLPGLIVSDLNMPRMSGFELLAVARERFPHIATIALSGEKFAEGYPSTILADAFLQKGYHSLTKIYARKR